MNQTVTADTAVLSALTSAGSGGLSMSAAIELLTDYEPAQVRERIRTLWEADRVSRQADGTFVLRSATASGGGQAKRSKSQRALAEAVHRLATQNARRVSEITVTYVDPKLLNVSCSTCERTVLPHDDGTCPDCGTQTGAHRTGRRRRRKPVLA